MTADFGFPADALTLIMPIWGEWSKGPDLMNADRQRTITSSRSGRIRAIQSVHSIELV
jgi:hypothetical protein